MSAEHNHHHEQSDILPPKSLYELYVDFERKYVNWILTRRSTEWQKRRFKQDYKLLPEKKFYRWLQSMEPEEQREKEDEWRMGFDVWIHQIQQGLKDLLGLSDNKK